MTLDEALRQARIAVDAPHPDGYISDQTGISRAVLRQVLDELAATSRGTSTLPRPATITLADYVTLRDRFAMHAPLEPLSLGSDAQAVALYCEARWAYADVMMATRGTQ